MCCNYAQLYFFEGRCSICLFLKDVPSAAGEFGKERDVIVQTKDISLRTDTNMTPKNINFMCHLNGQTKERLYIKGFADLIYTAFLSTEG